VWWGHEPEEDVLRKLQEELGPELGRIEDAPKAHQRPKLEEYGHCLSVASHGNLNEQAHSVITGETHLFVGERYIVSVRHGETQGYADVRGRCECTPHLLSHGPGFVLYALMDSIVDRYFPIIDSFEEEIETLEEAIFDNKVDATVAERIYGLKRDVMAAKRAVSPLFDVCNGLFRYDLGLIADEVRPYFRDVYDHVVRINESTDSVRELLGSALEANLALTSIRQNEVS
jgi:magnesium transporter